MVAPTIGGMTPAIADALLQLGGWALAFVIVFGALVVTVLAIVLKVPRLALAGLAPLASGVMVLAFSPEIAAHDDIWPVLALGLAALGVLGGGPVTQHVLRRAAPTVRTGAHGGILIPADANDTGASAVARGLAPGAVPGIVPGPLDAPGVPQPSREVLRGGTVIGYLERVAIVGAIVLGRFEIVAAVIAIKGLGRFSELATAEARERFIIGTLTSLIWASAFGALIVLPRFV